MKSDYTTNSRYITHTIAFWKVGRIHFLSSGVKGLSHYEIDLREAVHVVGMTWTSIETTKHPWPFYLWTPVTLSSTIPFKVLNVPLNFLYNRWVASPPSSRTKLDCHPGAVMHCSIHHQKSSSDSPFHANIGTPESIPNHLVYHLMTTGESRTWQSVWSSGAGRFFCLASRFQQSLTRQASVAESFHGVFDCWLNFGLAQNSLGKENWSASCLKAELRFSFLLSPRKGQNFAAIGIQPT